MSMKTRAQELEAFHSIKREILATIEEMRRARPEAAEYLESHLVMDEQACTFTYTGDDRLQLRRVGGAGDDEQPEDGERAKG